MGLSFMASLTYGNDQMANQYQARFANFPGLTDSKQVTLRVKGSVDPPDNQISTYEVEYQGVKYSMLSAKDETDKTVTLTFRLDAEWAIYDALKNWLALVIDTSRGTNASGFSNYNKSASFPTMYIDCFKVDKAYVSSIKYENIRLMSMKINSFDHSSSDPSEIECQFIYELATVTVESGTVAAIGITA